MPNVFTGVLNGAVQTGYFVAPPEGLPGQQVFIEQNHIINGYPAQSDFLYCGRGVVKGTDITVAPDTYGNNISPFGVIVPTPASTAADFVGVLLLDHGAANDENGNAGKRIHDMVGILEEGFCFVKLHQDTVARGAVFMIVNAENPLSAPVGSFVSDATSGAAIEVPRLQWWATYNHLAQPYGIVRVYSPGAKDLTLTSELAAANSEIESLKSRVSALEA
jgi:hypothetical protein